MIAFFYACISLGVISGVVIVLRGGPENSLIGLNVATICAATGLLAMDGFMGVGYAKEIAFYLIFPGILGPILFSRFIGGVCDA